MLFVCLFILSIPFFFIEKKYKKTLLLSDFKFLSGIFILCIICSHLALANNDSINFRIMSTFIYILVATFFAMSGYGLQVSLENNKLYLKKLLKSRIPRIISAYILANIIYYMYFYYCEKIDYPLSEIGMNFMHGKVFVDYSWFMIALIYLYFCFYISKKLQNIIPDYIILGTGIIIYLIFCKNMLFPSHWFTSVGGFLVGVYFEKIKDHLPKNFTSIVLIFILYTSSVLLRFLVFKNIIDIDFNILNFVFSAFITCLIFNLLLYYSFYNKIIIILGECSLELYLYQGIAIRICKNIFETYNYFICLITTLTILIPIVLLVNIKNIKKHFSQAVKNKE